MFFQRLQDRAAWCRVRAAVRLCRVMVPALGAANPVSSPHAGTTARRCRCGCCRFAGELAPCAPRGEGRSHDRLTNRLSSIRKAARGRAMNCLAAVVRSGRAKLKHGVNPKLKWPVSYDVIERAGDRPLPVGIVPPDPKAVRFHVGPLQLASEPFAPYRVRVLLEHSKTLQRITRQEPGISGARDKRESLEDGIVVPTERAPHLPYRTLVATCG